MIAATSETRTPYPKSLTLVELGEVLVQAQNSKVVIKRDYSDSSKWTFLPSRTRARVIEGKFQETFDHYHKIKKLPYPAWITQPYMPDLRKKGEIRVFFGGWGSCLCHKHMVPTVGRRRWLCHRSGRKLHAFGACDMSLTSLRLGHYTVLDCPIHGTQTVYRTVRFTVE